MVYLLGSFSVEAHTRPLQQLGICLEIAYEQVVLRMDFVSVLCEGLGMGHPLVFGFAVGQHQLSDLVLGWQLFELEFVFFEEVRNQFEVLEVVQGRTGKL